MDILKMAAELFMKNTGSTNLDAGAVMNGLKSLLADQSGNIDLAALVSKFSNSGLSTLVTSWLGDGKNESISTDQLAGVLGGDKVSKFASGLGMDTGSATQGLSEMIPQLIDKSSSGGSLLGANTLGKALGSLGGLGGLFR